MGPTRSFTIYTNDQLTKSKDWNDVIVAYRNGAPLRVRDIGQAVTGPQDTTQAAWADGKPGVFPRHLQAARRQRHRHRRQRSRPSCRACRPPSRRRSRSSSWPTARRPSARP